MSRPNEYRADDGIDGPNFESDTASERSRSTPPATMARARRIGDRRLLMWSSVAALGLACLAIVAFSATPSPASPVAPAAQVVAAPTPTPTPTPTLEPVATTPFQPARVRIGSVEITAPVEPVGTTSDGQMEIPADPMVVGWWEGSSPALGVDQGNTVLAGHVFNTGWGPGVFAELENVRAGDEVDVLSDAGERAPYTVTAVERIPKTDFPAERIFALSGPHQLVLATCGDYDAATRHWEDNVFVFASPTV